MKPGSSESRWCTGSRTSTKFPETGMYRAMSFSSEVVAKNERKNVRKVRHDPPKMDVGSFVINTDIR